MLGSHDWTRWACGVTAGRRFKKRMGALKHGQAQHTTTTKKPAAFLSLSPGRLQADIVPPKLQYDSAVSRQGQEGKQ